MKKKIEYAKHAKECRAMAARTNLEEHRKQLLTMAETWEALAAERERTERANEKN
jgi:hypothetical protein